MLNRFDKVIERKNTASVKWDFMDTMFAENNLLPLWVADMDFAAPEEVTEAIVRRARHGIFGYSLPPESYFDAVVKWMKKRHNWDIDKEWIVVTPGVVPALSFAVQSYTVPGDNIIIQRPVYYPFSSAISKNKRNVLNNALIFDGSKYVMDYKDLEKKAADPRTRLMLLCSPHNPVGRVWSEQELKTLGNICRENGVTIVSDEIHGDLILSGYRHTPFTMADTRFMEHTIVCTAPSKTFNLAGLQMSNIIIPDKELRKKFRDVLNSHALYTSNPLGLAAVEAAYNYGENWLNQVIEYIESNFKYLDKFIKKEITRAKFIQPQGTYLAWVDFSAYRVNREQLSEKIIKGARVALDQGYIFGDEGDGFQRINVACPRSILQECLKRIAGQF